jgi:chitosanase
MESINIPCEDCEKTAARYRLRGYKVLGCEPTGDGKFCKLKFAQGLSDVSAELTDAFVSKRSGAGSVSQLTPLQTRCSQAIVNIFETGAVLGRYDLVTVLKGDTGRLTYGRSQTSLFSGNLLVLLQRYCAETGAACGALLRPYLESIQKQDQQVDTDLVLHNILRAAADDLLMREVQDQFFDQQYWQPAVKAANSHGIFSALGVAVVYDSHIHGSWINLRKVVDTKGTPSQRGEQAWIKAYVDTRREWLTNHKNTLLRKTVYRMDAFLRLIALNNWSLTLPFVVRSEEISLNTLNTSPPGCYDGPAVGSRALMLQQPLLRGHDVRRVQLGLSQQGLPAIADGIFGDATQRLIKEWQAGGGKVQTGILDVATVLSLAS